MVSFPQPCGQDAYRDGTSVVTALSRQGLNAPGTGAILHSADAVVAPAVTQCLGFSVQIPLPREPSKRVFLLGDVELCNNWGTATNRNLHTGQQVVTKQTASAEERVRLFRLAWDTCCSAFATRQVLYERWFGGDSFRNAIILANLYDREPMTHWVREFLEQE